MTVNDVYTTVCWTLLEDNGLVFFSTPQDVIDTVQTTLLDFLQRTTLVKEIISIPMVAGTADYSIGDDHIRPEAVICNGRALNKVTGSNLDNTSPMWTSEAGPPQRWQEQYADPQHFTINPTPEVNGTLLVVAAKQFVPSGFNLGTTLPVIKDSFVPFLEFAVLEKIFSTDGEAKDTARAKYCHARSLEGMNIAKAISQEDILEDVQ